MNRLIVTAICAVACGSAQITGRVAGRVTAEGADQPLRAEVTTLAAGTAVRISSSITDQRGAFAVDAPAGRILMVARADGYASEQTEVVVQPGRPNATVNFSLPRAGTVSGRVFDPSGGSPANARVWLQYRGESRAWRVADETGGDNTDAFGNFTIPVVARGRPFILHAESDEFLLSSSRTMILRGQEISGVTLLLTRRGATVSGQVLDSAGQPVAGAQIHLRVIPADTEFTAEQRTSIPFSRSTNKIGVSRADGWYTFSGVPAGRVILRTESQRRQAAAEGDIAGGTAVTINLSLP